MSLPENSAALVIKPSAEAVKNTLKTTPLLLIVLMLFVVVRGGLDGLLPGLAGAAAVAALSYWHFTRMRVVVTPSEFGRMRLIGGMVMRPRSEIATVLLVSLRAASLDARNFGNLFLLDTSGRSLLRLRSSHWAEDDVTRLIDHLGVTPVSPDRSLTAKELSADYPRALPWAERHPVILTLLLFLLIAAALVGVFAIVLATGT